MVIETRIATYAFAGMTEDEESTLKEVCKRFAKDMRYDFEFSYYSVYWEEEAWLNANLALPGIDTILKRVP
jgi:hypothetical protein